MKTISPLDIIRKDPAALAEWHRLIEHQADLELIPGLNARIMAAYCQACGELQSLFAELRGKSTFYRAEDGRVLLSPYVRTIGDLTKEIISLGRHLGIREYRPRGPRRSRAERLFNLPVSRENE